MVKVRVAAEKEKGCTWRGLEWVQKGPLGRVGANQDRLRVHPSSRVAL